ncbi:hypothetical protein P5673_025017 [Acropora cervicornis]|uniref:Uncharacterized protein n=1 Tax=Acropora cervicornis TaxID=6130 RepID=A0AAD9UXM8_ACRCE|nr:hypothetical protein P5673_025017 [Acropora cervicornis]
MRESQEQQKRDNENSADKPEIAPAKKHLKDDKETDHIDSQSNKKNKGKQPKKRPVKSRADKSKETHKQLSNIANKTTAENEACTKATREIYQTFMAAFPGTNSKETAGNQVSLVEELQDSDAEEETDGTAGEWSFSPITDTPDSRTSPSLGEPMVIPSHVQQQMSPLASLPPRVPVTPSTSNRQELLPQTQSRSLNSRSGTSLSETAEAFVRAMNGPSINVDEHYFPPGGFRDFVARPLGQDMSHESRKQLVQLQEENSQLHDEIAMLRVQLNSSAKKQPAPWTLSVGDSASKNNFKGSHCSNIRATTIPRESHLV